MIYLYMVGASTGPGAGVGLDGDLDRAAAANRQTVRGWFKLARVEGFSSATPPPRKRYSSTGRGPPPLVLRIPAELSTEINETGLAARREGKSA